MLRQARRRLLSSAAHAVGDFSAVRVLPHADGNALVAAQSIARGAVAFRFTGKLCRANIGDRSLMVGREAHLTSEPEEQPWVFLNHSFTPSVQLAHDAVASADAPPPILTATANVPLAPGDFLTIDYTLHEWDMFGDGFECAESGRQVRGFRHLSEAEQDAALPRAMPHIKTLHLQYLFGQSSRC